MGCAAGCAVASDSCPHVWLAAVEGTAGLLLQECQSPFSAGLPLVSHGVRAAPVPVPLSKLLFS